MASIGIKGSSQLIPLIEFSVGIDDTKTFTVGTGASKMKGILEVQGQTTLKENVSIEKSLSIGQNTSIIGSLDITDDTTMSKGILSKESYNSIVAFRDNVCST